MGKKYLASVVSGLMAMSVTGGAMAMNITGFDSAANLAAALGGSGITISNASYTGSPAASGYFTGGTAAGIGIEQGVILTSGYAANLQGTSNTSTEKTGDNQLSGSAILDPLIPGYTTYDATILSFDFEIAGGNGGNAYFDFVFGSEEYNEWVDSVYNDVFGFFLDGTSNNVALIPGTTTPVSINNVNNGMNLAYFNDNESGAYPFELDGFTDVIQVQMLGLTAGKHTLTLAIADAGDWVLDSAVFIKGSSLSDTPNDAVPEPATMLLFGTGLVGFAASRRKKKSS